VIGKETTVPIEKIIHFVTPAQLSAAQRQVINRARLLHPKWEIKLWQQPIEDEGFSLARYWKKVNTEEQLADLVRLDAIYRWGGVYLDSDMLLLKALDPLVDGYEFFVASEDGVNLTNAVFAAKKDHRVIRGLIDDLLWNEPDWTLPQWLTTGTLLFTRKLKWEQSVAVLPRETFYPYNWNEAGRSVRRTHTYAEHLSVSSRNTKLRPATAETVHRQSRRGRLMAALKRPIKRAVASAFRAGHRIYGLDPIRSYRLTMCYPSSEELIVKTPHGFKLVIDGRDMSITPELVFDASYEGPEEHFVKKNLSGGDFMIDVGANIGLFTVLAARQVGTYGRVFAYEPNPAAMKLLTKSLVMNWMHERVARRPVAVGAAPGTVKLSFHPASLGGATADSEGLAGGAFSQTIKALGEEELVVLPDVKCVRLDDEFSVDLPIKLLKIDVEGFEGQVLQGAKRLLERHCIQFIIVELLEEVAASRWGETLEEAKKLLTFGYSVCSLDAEGNAVPQPDIGSAVRLGGRNIVFACPSADARASPPPERPFVY
jgi:FkbM family methyltransferase